MPELQVDPIDGFRIDEHTTAGVYPVKDTSSRIQWFDFIDWYRKSMAEYAGLCMSIARKHFPDLPIYLCTGGYGQTYHGTSFSDQCKIAASYGAGLRITNEASYFANNFVTTNWVSSSGTFYKTYYGFEPAGRINTKGVVARIFNVTSSGASELHCYGDNVFGNQEKNKTFIENIQYIHLAKPKKDIPVLYPDLPVIFGDTSHLKFARINEMI